MDIIGFFGVGSLLVVGGLLVVKFFPNEIAALWRRLGAPSESDIKKQSDERLAEMERNIAERKARKGR